MAIFGAELTGQGLFTAYPASAAELQTPKIIFAIGVVNLSSHPLFRYRN
jgi:hypothetical protein